MLNDVLLPAMKDVGDRFGARRADPAVRAAVRRGHEGAVAHLETYLDKEEGQTKGKVVLATVFGDVHDIGKNLVNTILSNNGYTVYDLGKQVPINTIIEKAVEVDADAIGLSALLVSTSKQMPLCVQELHARGLDVPGAGRRRGDQPPFGRRIRFLEDERAVRAGRLLLQGRVRGPGRTMDAAADPAAAAGAARRAARRGGAPPRGGRRGPPPARAGRARRARGPAARAGADAAVPRRAGRREHAARGDVWTAWTSRRCTGSRWGGKNASGAE